MKRAQYIISKGFMVGIPIAKVVFQVIRNNWGVAAMFTLFNCFVYWVIGGVIPLFLLVIFLTGEYTDNIACSKLFSLSFIV